MNNKIIFLCLLKFICMVNSSRILMVFPAPVHSHFFLGKALAKALLNAGHELVMISPFEDEGLQKTGKYRTVLLTGIETFTDGYEMPSWIEMGDMIPVFMDINLKNVGNLLTNFTVNHPNFQTFIRSQEKFDVIIFEQFLTDGLRILGCHFDAPVIILSTFVTNFWTNAFTANPSPPSYIPDTYTSYTPEMNLWQRTMNSLLILMRHLVRHWFFFPSQEVIIKQHFPECHSKFYQSLYNVSLTLVNSHESINYALPMVPNMVQIGGYHLVPPKALSGDIQKFIDEAEDGVIYFSLGTNIDSSAIDANTKAFLLRTFKKLKQRVLWKWEEGVMEDKPDNVWIQKFFPQQDILAHPNVKLFITHGGLLSTMEAVYNGVPLLCLPVFGDQKFNSAKIQNDGYGLNIWLTKLNEENLSKALDSLLNNPKYRENVKKRSILFRDRPIQPTELAIYWIEYVIKHQNVRHLRVAAFNLEWYQYFLLDVVCVVLFSLLTIATCIFSLFLVLYKRVFKSKKLKTN